VSHIVYGNLLELDVNFVDDTILTNAKAMEPFSAGELYCLLRKWIGSEFLNTIQDS